MNIKYPSRGSTFTPGFRNVIERQRDLLDQGDAVAIDIEATYPGYPGDKAVRFDGPSIRSLCAA